MIWTLATGCGPTGSSRKPPTWTGHCWPRAAQSRLGRRAGACRIVVNMRVIATVRDRVGGVAHRRSSCGWGPCHWMIERTIASRRVEWQAETCVHSAQQWRRLAAVWVSRMATDGGASTRSGTTPPHPATAALRAPSSSPCPLVHPSPTCSRNAGAGSACHEPDAGQLPTPPWVST